MRLLRKVYNNVFVVERGFFTALPRPDEDWQTIETSDCNGVALRRSTIVVDGGLRPPRGYSREASSTPHHATRRKFMSR